MNANPDPENRQTPIVARRRIWPQQGWLERCRASFEEAAARPPQDEDRWVTPRRTMPRTSLPHPEERAQPASRRTLSACAALFLLPTAAFAAQPAQPPQATVEAQETAYNRCMDLAKTDPGAARDMAAKWAAQGGAHPADHCYAVALIGLKQYKPAAQRLDKLAEAMLTVAPDSLRAEVLDQAGQAWLLGGDAARAYNDTGAALALAPGDPDILIDRAEAAGEAGWFDKALGDLDIVLKADPRRVDALIYRATAYRALDKLDPALADADAAVHLAPNSAQAVLERGNIRGLKGDADGARQDWRMAMELAPGSAAALAAKANLARLGQPAATPPAPLK
jgi:tetratricopeptide (TPR) repeat protein